VGQEHNDQQDAGGRSAEAERSAREHQANANQLRHEPVPASPRDDRDQDAVRRNAEFAASSAREGREHGTADDAGFTDGEWRADTDHAGTDHGDTDHGDTDHGDTDHDGGETASG
jgi:hypothetical protein